jgi:hypothetical protein
MTISGTIVDNADLERFELDVDGWTAIAEYRRMGNAILFIHTEVPDALQHRGVGSALARGALESASERGLEVVPLCPFMASYIRSHAEYLDLVSASNRRRLGLEPVE